MSENNWSVDAFFDGKAKPATGLGYQEPDEGVYQVKVTSVTLSEKKDDPSVKSIVLDMQIVGEGPCLGMTMKRWLTVPSSNMDDKKRETHTAFMKGALIGLGGDRAKVESAVGAAKLSPAAFMGKIGHVHYTPRPDQEKGSFSDVRFIDAETFKQVRAGTLIVKLKGAARVTGGNVGPRGAASDTNVNPFDTGSFDAPPVTNGASTSPVSDFLS